MILQDEIKINHYKVTTDTDTSYKEDFYYAPVKGEDAKRHREDGPALVYNSKTEEMTYLEWWNKGKMVAIFNSKSNKFKKTEDGSFMGLREVQLPENLKGLEKTLTLSDIEACTQLVVKSEAVDAIAPTGTVEISKEKVLENIRSIQEKAKNPEPSPRERLIGAMYRNK